MKNFGSIFLAAVLGSVCTIATFQWLDKDENKGVKLEYLAGTPATKVAYSVNENGEAIPLDFTDAAEKVISRLGHRRNLFARSVSRNAVGTLA